MFNLPGNPLVFVGGEDCRIQAWDTDAAERSYILAQPCSHQPPPGSDSRTGPDAPQTFAARQVGEKTVIEEIPPRGSGIDRPGQQAARGGPQAPLVRQQKIALNEGIFLCNPFFLFFADVGGASSQCHCAECLLGFRLSAVICRCGGRH